MTNNVNAPSAGAPRPGEWLELLNPAGEPRLGSLGAGGPVIWRIPLGHLDPWPHPIDRIRDRKRLYGKQSAALIYSGQPWCAELEIARRLNGRGWAAKWLLHSEPPPSHFHPWVSMHSRGDDALPVTVRDALAQLGRWGAPDVIAWRAQPGDLRMVALESKRVGRNADRLGKKQLSWFARALESGLVAQEDLAVVEWRNDRRTEMVSKSGASI